MSSTSSSSDEPGDGYVDYDRFSQTSPGQRTDWKSVARILDASSRSEAVRIRDELDRIEDQLEDRRELNQSLVDQLSFMIGRYESELDSMENLFRGSEEDRHRFRERIRELREELRSERRAFWNDRQRLEADRRELLRELAELEDVSLSELLH